MNSISPLHASRGSVFILLPSFDPTGPVKGAFALANALAGRFRVTVVALKPQPREAPLPFAAEGVTLHSLAKVAQWRAKLSAYRALLDEAQGSSGARPVSISMCFSADMVNAACRRHATLVSSVRSNLRIDYAMAFGWRGHPLATLHYFVLNRFDRIIAMTQAMAREIAARTRHEAVVIGNFVDEPYLEKYRRAAPTGALRFIFLGSLTQRKQPFALLDAMERLAARGIAAHLDVVGHGPLAAGLANAVASRDLGTCVTLHGHLDDPYPLLAGADVMVLPSLSEGLSRASLEALFLGIPCVLRNVDGNAELVTDGANGALFDDESELPECLLRAAELGRRAASRTMLLPPQFSQQHARDCFTRLVERGAA